MRFLFCFIISFSTFSQIDKQSKKFDSILYDISIRVSPTNPVKAIFLADSLYLYAKNKKQKTKALMLNAYLFEKQGQSGEAIVKALKVLEIAKEEKEYLFKSRIYSFLSKQYRTLGFIDTGKTYINKALEVSQKISDKNKLTVSLAICNGELAAYAIAEKDYKQAIKYFKLAILKFNKEDKLELKSLFLANTEEKIARCYMELDEREQAFSYFYKAKYHIHKAYEENTPWASLIYQGLGNLHLQSKKIDSAGIYLKKALSVTSNNSSNTLKKHLYKSASNYFQQINEIDSFYVYNAKYNTVVNESIAHKQLMINNAFKTLNEQQNKKLNNNNNNNNNLLYLILLVLGFFVVYFIQKKIFQKQKNTPINHNDNTSFDLLSEKIECELIQKVKEFEDSKHFLDKNISLPTLIGLLNTNTTYFRSFLKKHKNTDYNNYINELRIQYIKEKLTTDKNYLNYKISYLANECGFRSHSKFSTNFKKFTGLCPSEFITDLRNKSS